MPSTDIMEFKTFADIQGHFQIALDLLLKKENFSHGVWPYKLYQSEASCQYEKLGKRCAQPHQKGYVVSCTDGSVVLIGNCCAHKYLSLDDESVRAGFKQLDANRRQSIRRRRVESLLKKRQSYIEQGKALHLQHRDMQARIAELYNTFPRQIWQKLIDRWKTNRLEVVWEYQITKTGTENGRKVVEKSWYPSSYGKLTGLGAWLEWDHQTYAGRISDYRKQLELIPAKDQLTNAEIDHAEATLNNVAAITSLERELGALSKMMSDFVEPSNLVRAVQLTSNQSVRAETVIAVHRLTGDTLAMTPERFVVDIDVALKRKHDATGLRIQQ
ncbi:hypothetical protein IFT47_11135 [Pseudomonas sp. CFBP 13711]|uniref:hypothetical protein n=1 Tax=unclassified Pseudomonas TaxID=196821 RepID=UPI001783705B|nr:MULTISPECIES: hypothetical protein [unclassified Pseudomonas]MBD8707189.1 hypothetical protein [Pseudomonas sp. CFBP 13711]MBD8714812.1 hypothetical protein [Pseudomonas sp. CFBP 13715]